MEKILLDLLSIDSQNPTSNEVEVGEYIINFLKKYNYSPKKIEVKDGRFNVFLAGDLDLLFVNHMDTVPVGNLENWDFNPFGEMHNGKIYGRGACDNKGNIAVILSTLAYLDFEYGSNKKIPNVLFTISEEVDFLGVKHFAKNFKDYSDSELTTAIVFEPKLAKIYNTNKGILMLEVGVKGKAAHGSSPELGENAIYKASEIILKLKEYHEKISSKSDSKFGKSTLNVGVIEGGEKVNTVPSYCKFELERRIVAGEDIDLVLDEIKSIIGDGADVKIKFRLNPAFVDENSNIIVYLKSILNAFDKDTKIYSSPGCTELSEISGVLGLDGVIFGFGDLKYAHSANELIEVKDLLDGEEILRKIILNYDS